MAQTILPQVIVAFLGNLGPLCFGLHIGWFSPLENRLKSQESPLSRRISDDEASWLAAIPTAAILAGMPFFGWLLQSASRRTALLLATLPHAVIFIGYSVTPDVLATTVLRFFAGFISAGAIVVCPVYISDCVHPRWRGAFCGSTAFFVNSGVAISCAVGAYCSYNRLNLVSFSLPALMIVSLPWLPESPVRLLSEGDPLKAKKCLQTLRADDNVDDELSDMIAALKAAEPTDKSSCMNLLHDAVSKRALVIIGGVMTMQQLCGVSPINSYLVEIIGAISSLDTFLTSVVINFLQLAASAIAPLLLTIAGRKTILIISGWAMTAALTVIAICGFFFKNSVPAASLAVFMFAYNVGLGSVPFVLLPELLPPASRGAAVAIVGTWVGGLCFLVTKQYHYLVNLASVYGVFGVFAICCFLGTVFIHLVVFETKGMAAEEIFTRLRLGKKGASNQSDRSSNISKDPVEVT